MGWTPATSGKPALVRKVSVFCTTAAFFLMSVEPVPAEPQRFGAAHPRAGEAAGELSVLQVNLLVGGGEHHCVLVVSLDLHSFSISPW